MRRALLLSFALAGFASMVPAAGHADDAYEFGLTFHVATDADGASVIDAPRLDAWVERTNQLFAPSGVSFMRADLRTMPPGAAHLTTIAERRALARRLIDRRINVFVVSRIDDPNPSEATRRASAREGREPSGRLAGAHIRVAGHRPDTFILLIARDDGTSLAHELGHFFGAPHHRDSENVMSYGRARDHFEPRQLEVFSMFARRYRRRGVLG